MNEDMRGCNEDEFELQFYCEKCEIWYDHNDMYSEVMCNECYDDLETIGQE